METLLSLRFSESASTTHPPHDARPTCSDNFCCGSTHQHSRTKTTKLSKMNDNPQRVIDVPQQAETSASSEPKKQDIFSTAGNKLVRSETLCPLARCFCRHVSGCRLERFLLLLGSGLPNTSLPNFEISSSWVLLCLAGIILV